MCASCTGPGGGQSRSQSGSEWRPAKEKPAGYPAGEVTGKSRESQRLVRRVTYSMMKRVSCGGVVQSL